jgi:hypothetical protein
VLAAVTIGLSEIILAGKTDHGDDIYAVIERDNQYGLPATWKRVFVFTLPEQSCDAATTVSACVAAGAVISKHAGADLLGASVRSRRSSPWPSPDAVMSGPRSTMSAVTSSHAF